MGDLLMFSNRDAGKQNISFEDDSTFGI